ncbi:MAG: hypothetical protein Q9212_001346 [Teloschistes hypoglaucus]
MSSRSTKSTTFLVLSDTHNIEPQAFIDTVWPARTEPPKIDVVLHCGDLTRVGGLSSFKQALKTLGTIDAELKLVIAGNHDLQLDKHYCTTHPEKHGKARDPDDHDKTVELMKGSLAAEAGVSYLDEGTYSFDLKNGARFTLYASPYTPAFFDWAFAYGENEDRFNPSPGVSTGTTAFGPNPIPDGVDIVMTHGPPKGVLDRCAQGSVGCEKLAKAIKRVKPIMLCFGHIHGGHGLEIMEWRSDAAKKGSDKTTRSPLEVEYSALGKVESVSWLGKRGKQTLAVNAAIETEVGMPPNAPWLVTLDLPRSK